MHGPRAAAVPPSVVIPEVDQSAVAVLLVDPQTGLVTYANPPALRLTGDRAPLPAEAGTWSAAARLRPVPGARTWRDPVEHVASGGTVSGWRVAFAGADPRPDGDDRKPGGTDPRPDGDGDVRTYWATGSQLLAGTGNSPGAMVAFFPIHADGRSSPGTAVDAAVDAALEAADATQAGPHGAVRADSTLSRARTLAEHDPITDVAVGTITDAVQEAVQDTAEDAATLMTDGALTARALLASSISFTISDPRREDNPLIWVNPAFERMTGYAVDGVVGRNCRFLQGPGTDRAEVARIRDALAAGESIGTELLNYRTDGTAFWNSMAISPVLDGDGVLTHYVGVQTDVTARVLAGAEHDRLLAAEREARAAAERAQAQLALIERVGALLSETLDSEEALQRVVNAVVPALADCCAVDVVDGGADDDDPGRARVRRVAVAHRDPDLAPLYWRLGELDRRMPERTYIPTMLRTGRSLHVPPMDDATYRARSGGDEEAYQLIRALDVHSGAVVPLRARGRVIAVLSLVVTHGRGRAFSEEDLALAESLAARAALAVDNARLFEAEAAQRRYADALASAGQAMAGSLRSADVVDVLLERAVPAFADWAFVHVDSAASPALRPLGVRNELHPAGFRHADVQLEASCGAFLADWPVAPDHPGPGLAWSTGRAQLITDLQSAMEAASGVSADLRVAVRALGVTSALSVPLTARGLTVGTLTVCRHGGRPFDAQELRFVDELAKRGALALENARLYESQRVVALELQRSLLPDRLPSLPDLDVAGRYLAGAAGTEVGGDWYDVVPLPGGRVAVAVGDVMGRGLRAAAVMGQMRSALRSYAVEGLDPPDVLARLAAFTRVMEGEHLVTCVVGLYDPACGTVRLASAGHPPPLLLGADGRARLIDLEPGLPLGVPALGPDGVDAYRSTQLTLSPDAALVLYTDGLVEDRDVPVGEGLERLELGMNGVRTGSADDVCDVALRVMGRLDSHDDDTAVLVLRVPPGAVGGVSPAGTDARRVQLLDGGPPSAAASRRVVRDTLAEHAMSTLQDSATLLVSELVTNALRHGGGPRELIVDVDPGGVTVSVSDSSPAPPLQRDQWATPVDVLPENGRGLLLVEALADDWGWLQEPAGKRVWFRLRSRPETRPGDRVGRALTRTVNISDTR
jgi:PAS domain S-box-containing protein